MIKVFERSPRFAAIMKLYIERSKKTAAEAVNHRLLQLVVGSGKGAKYKGLVQLTRRATQERIRSDLAKVVTYRTKDGRTLHGVTMQKALAIQWLVDNGKQLTPDNIAKSMRAVEKAKFASIAFIAASWLASAAKLAEKVPTAKFDRLQYAPEDHGLKIHAGGQVKKDAKAVAAMGDGTKATAIVYNTAPNHPNNAGSKKNAAGAAKVATQYIGKAISAQIRDMKAYLKEKMKKDLREEYRKRYATFG